MYLIFLFDRVSIEKIVPYLTILHAFLKFRLNDFIEQWMVDIELLLVEVALACYLPLCAALSLEHIK